MDDAVGDPFDDLRLDASTAVARSRPQRPRHHVVAVVATVAAIAGVAVLSTRSDAVLGDRPPAGHDAADAPLGTPPPAPVGGGSHAFVHVHEDGSPVAYDPCRPIHVVLNHRMAPAGGTELVQQALADVTAATGLRFVVDGPTSEVPSDDRAAYQEDRYGDRWAPVLVAWSDPTELPDLTGDVAGRAGSTAVASSGNGDHVYVTGTVALDGPQFAGIIASRGPEEALAVIRHELGHLVGLDHVSDPTQLMYEQSMPGITTFQDGDRTGLVALGTGACRPDV
jgi:hypothetical protein